MSRRYSTIVVDPPWRVKAGRPLTGYVVRDGKQVFNAASNKTRDLSYDTMSVHEISNLPVGQLAAKDAHLYLWTINRYLRDAFDIADAWGFRFSTMLTWAKNPKGGGLGGPFGISTEYCLFCRRGTLGTLARIGTTWFNWPRHYHADGSAWHSAKPPAFIDMVEQVSPGPYLEMFARDNRLGWDAYGNECLSISGLTTTYQPPQD